MSVVRRGEGPAPELLRHVSLLLTLYSGAGLATAARLKWDPSTYVLVRALFPAEYRLGAALLPAGAAVLLALAHLSLLALRRRSRPLLLLYAVLMSLLAAAEVVLVVWARAQVVVWLGSAQARDLREALAVRDHLQPLLHYFSKWHPLPEHIKAVIQEAEDDLPRNGYVSAAAGAALLALQLVAVALAIIEARRLQRQRAHRSAAGAGGGAQERTPLRTTYRGGQLVPT